VFYGVLAVMEEMNWPSGDFRLRAAAYEVALSAQAAKAPFFRFSRSRRSLSSGPTAGI